CSADTFRSVPENYIKRKNFQFARTGNAYIYLDYQNGGDRQYMQIKLTDSLQKNKYYYAEHFVNIPNGLRFSCNNVGMLFTKTAVYVDTVAEKYGVLLANPQVVNYGNPALGDTVNWIKVSGVFKAQGGEQYLTLGNFKQDSNTILKQIQPTGSYSAGYVIDDVSIIPLDSFCLKADAGRDTIIKVGDSVFIGSYTNGIDTIKWYNASGQVIDSARPGFWAKPSATGTTMYIVEQTVNGCFSRDTVYINAVLPLTMSSYQVVMSNERQVLNKWVTMNEVNVSHYNIQRSTNGKDFTVIGKVKANNKSFNEYNFTDLLTTNYSLLTTLYYRIVGVDNDGKLSYSEVRQLAMGKEQLAISIFPNPAKDVVNITPQKMW
ncbi:MAG: hypothetical protein NTZ59_13695, partial [Bacteroidetes bacterium]|nr:hypothetical protein [Bacteroidota bacterium]